MGLAYMAICEDCGHTYRANDGGGFVFHLLHCDACGQEKSIGFEEIGEPHLQYLKGLEGPYCIATAKRDRAAKKRHPGPAISEKEYHRIVETLAGQCGCGGRFKFDAPIRCPKCKSTRLKQDPNGDTICYD